MRWPTTTRICRVLNQFPVNACGEPVKEINSGELVSVAPGARRPVVSFEDVLPPASIAAQNQATYAIEVVNQRGRSAEKHRDEGGARRTQHCAHPAAAVNSKNNETQQMARFFMTFPFAPITPIGPMPLASGVSSR